MKANIWLAAFAAAVLFSCVKVKDSSEIEKIRSLEEKSKNEKLKAADPKAMIDKAVYQDLFQAYIAFVEKYPDASESPEFLFQAAQLYNDTRGLDNKGKAIELFTRTYTEYPDHENAALSMFLAGYIYANDLRDELKAERIYKLYLEKYPSGKMATSAKAELKNLGKTDAEALESIQKERTDSLSADTTSR